jgi:hypothetical protein
VLESDDLEVFVKKLFNFALLSLPGFVFLYTVLHKDLLKLDGLLFISLGLVISGCFLLAAFASWLVAEIVIILIDKSYKKEIKANSEDSIIHRSVSDLIFLPVLILLFLSFFVTRPNEIVSAHSLFFAIVFLSFTQGFVYRNADHKYKSWRQDLIAYFLMLSSVVLTSFLLHKLIGE